MRAVVRLGGLAVALVLLGACTPSGGPTSTPTPSVHTKTIVHTKTPTPGPTAPIDTGPTNAATASRCPFLAQPKAAEMIGMRLDRIAVLRSSAKIVGCRLYALQGSPLSQSEHLPGPNQPAIEIETVRYPSIVAAHNAFVRLGAKGTNLQRAAIVGQGPGLCFQTNFYPKDKGKDWACAFNVAKKLVVVRTVVTSPALSAILVARAVAKNL